MTVPMHAGDNGAEMKLVADVIRLPSGRPCWRLYAADGPKSDCDAVTNTLLDLVGMAHDTIAEVFGLLDRVQSGSYVREHPELADFGFNDVLVWVCPPEAAPGSLTISKEYVPEWSVEFGTPQQFTRAQLSVAVSHFEAFKRMVDLRDLEASVGHRSETSFVWEPQGPV